MRKIKLTKGQETFIDNKDYKKVSSSSWHCLDTKRGKYAASRINVKIILLHRFLLNPKENYVVDHIDGNGLNNRRSNIRLATYGENQRNGRRIITKHNTSGFRGVSLYTYIREKQWRATISVDKKQISLGYFNNPLEAAIAYNNGAKKYHKEFATLNRV